MESFFKDKEVSLSEILIISNGFCEYVLSFDLYYKDFLKKMDSVFFLVIRANYEKTNSLSNDERTKIGKEVAVRVLRGNPDFL